MVFSFFFFFKMFFFKNVFYFFLFFHFPGSARCFPEMERVCQRNGRSQILM